MLRRSGLQCCAVNREGEMQAKSIAMVISLKGKVTILNSNYINIMSVSSKSPTILPMLTASMWRSRTAVAVAITLRFCCTLIYGNLQKTTTTHIWKNAGNRIVQGVQHALLTIIASESICGVKVTLEHCIGLSPCFYG